MDERGKTGELVDSKPEELEHTSRECLYMRADLEKRNERIREMGMK
jgi:hypothetical protein